MKEKTYLKACKKLNNFKRTFKRRLQGEGQKEVTYISTLQSKIRKGYKKIWINV